MKIYVLKRKYRGEKQVKVGMTQNSVSTRLSYAGGGWKCIFSVELGDISKKKTLKYEGLIHRYLGKYQVSLGSYKEIFSCKPMYAAAVVKTITQKSIVDTERHLGGARWLRSDMAAPWIDSVMMLIIPWLIWCVYALNNEIIGPWWYCLGFFGSGMWFGILHAALEKIFAKSLRRKRLKTEKRVQVRWLRELAVWDKELEDNMLKLEK